MILVARRTSCRVANAYSTRLKLIWPRSSLKTTKMSKKMHFWQKVPRVTGLSLNEKLGFSSNAKAKICHLWHRELLAGSQPGLLKDLLTVSQTTLVIKQK